MPSGMSMLGGVLPPACYFILLVISRVAPRLAGRSSYETLAVSDRTVESCTQDCSQTNLPCRVTKGDCLPNYQDTWPLSPPRKMSIHIVLMKGVGPVLEINFTYSADANLISINKTVIAISQVGSIQCVTFWYLNGFPAQTNHRGELWSLTYYMCHQLKPAQLVSVSIYSIPPTEALVKNIRLPDCNNPMMKRYAEDYCPDIAIQCVLNDTNLTVTYTSSHPNREYLVYLCIWKSRYCSSEEAQNLAVVTKRHSLYHEEMECPFKGSHCLNIKLVPTPSSLQVLPSGFPAICTIRMKVMFYYKEDGTDWLTNISAIQELLVSESKMHEFSIKPTLQHKVLCVKVWSDDIYPLPEKIYCTQPKRTLSRWFAATSLICLVLGLLAALVLYKKYRKKSRLCQKLRKENEQLKMRLAPVKLLLLCSWDHRYFQEVIEAFAYYLQQDCKCEVMLELWERRQIAQKGAVIWLTEKLTAADKVTIIWSKGAEVKWMSKSLCEEDRPYFVEFEFGDLFTPALITVADQQARSLADKFSVVSFERISAGVQVPEIFRKKHTYKLMADLQKFQSMLIYVPGTKGGESVARQRLTDRIEAFAAYQRLSPSWFEDWHYREGHVSPPSPAFLIRQFSTLDKLMTEEKDPEGLTPDQHLKTTTSGDLGHQSKHDAENNMTARPLLLTSDAHLASLVHDTCSDVPQQSLALSSGYYSQPSLTLEGIKS
ncbi:uncharacterized protein LOC144511784 isoform X2 [Mustelus asterias]